MFSLFDLDTIDITSACGNFLHIIRGKDHAVIPKPIGTFTNASEVKHSYTISTRNPTNVSGRVTQIRVFDETDPDDVHQHCIIEVLVRHVYESTNVLLRINVDFSDGSDECHEIELGEVSINDVDDYIMKFIRDGNHV